ncbi:MAG: aryl-sulfate sulfotransferase [Pontiellaceae bacterium]|nr:aryl-sulfate sulfotransferase [Pontiellaceae bacterium]MBN2783881.1 aryl-sulfate sulfotransferase [Pontiellaceae bacterium]
MTNQSSPFRSAKTLLLCASLCFIFFNLGVGVGHFEVFPYVFYKSAGEGYKELIRQRTRRTELTENSRLEWFYVRQTRPKFVNPTPAQEKGYNLITCISDHLDLAVELRDMNGTMVHEWIVNWFDAWPDAQHLPDDIRPKSSPGTHIHGAVLLPNGNLVYNYEHLGTVCMDPDSRVVWKLPYRTHHSIHRHDDGTLWICAQKTRNEINPDFPNRRIPYDEYIILEVSQSGTVLKEWSVDLILKKNGLTDWLTTDLIESPYVLDDLLHLNDAEPFPEDMKPGFFGPGDIMVSLRNISTVFVFNRTSGKIKYVSSPGLFSLQHDPDFIDGNSYSVFDNNVPHPERWEPGTQSRILRVNVPEDRAEVIYEGTQEHPLFSRIMGKHQWLPNRNLLITEAMEGRAIEINPKGKIVWEWENTVGRNVSGLMEELLRLPENPIRTSAQAAP